MTLIVLESRSDAALVASVRRGEVDALGVLYERHAETLYRSVYRLLGNAHEAEDLVQDLFVGLPEALGTYGEQGKLGGWLQRVATRMALMRLRSRKRVVNTVAEALPVYGEIETLHSAMTLQRALHTLSEPLRTVFVLKEMEGYSHAEIAELLGIRRGTSEVRLHRALMALRNVLREED